MTLNIVKLNSKICTRCKESKSYESFSRCSNHNDGLKYWCKDCSRTQKLLSFYNMTPSDYNDMFASQKGCCKICGIHSLESHRALVIDHDHTSGKVRGLLCSTCNQGIGLLKDSADFCQRASEYLKENKQ